MVRVRFEYGLGPGREQAGTVRVVISRFLLYLLRVGSVGQNHEKTKLMLVLQFFVI